MKKIFFLFIVILLPVCYLQAQQYDQIKSLTVGDTIPDIVLRNLLHYKTPTARLSDYKGKVIVLDFWATWCGPCVGSMPKLDSLQKRFPRDLKIFLVSNEPAGTVGRFLDRRKDVNLPAIAQDTILHYTFRHKTIPHTIIINKQGKIVSVSNPIYLTPGVMEDVIAGRRIAVPQKNDMLSFNREQPIMIAGNGGEDNDIVYRSLVSHHINGIPSSAFMTTLDSNRAGFSCRNLAIPDLYMIAIQKPVMWSYTRLVFENVKDTTRYTRDIVHASKVYLDEWAKKNTYCYDLITAPIVSKSQRLMMMKQTLDNAFKGMYNMEASMEQRTIPCLIITQRSTGIDRRLVSKYRYDRTLQGSLMDTGGQIYRNISVTELTQALERIVLMPFVDETDYKGKIDLSIAQSIISHTRNTRQIDSLKAFLNQYGLDVSPGWRQLEALVIREDTSNNISVQHP